jgi:hypothetical protein
VVTIPLLGTATVFNILLQTGTLRLNIALLRGQFNKWPKTVSKFIRKRLGFKGRQIAIAEKFTFLSINPLANQAKSNNILVFF